MHLRTSILVCCLLYSATRLHLSKQSEQVTSRSSLTLQFTEQGLLLNMALARLCLSRALAGRAPALARPAYASAAPAMASSHSLFSSAVADTTARAPQDGETNRREVAVTDRSGSDTARRRGRWAWRDLRDFVPFRLVDGLGSAVSHVAETLSRPLERLAPSSSWWRPLLGKVREDEERYRLRFEVPGLGKDDVRITVEDGALVIRGEKRVEEQGGDDDGERWSASSYGCYHASLLLPDDARVEGITAEVKDGVLYVTVPRAGPGRERNVTEVKVQ